MNKGVLILGILVVIVLVGFVAFNETVLTGHAARVEDPRGERVCTDSDGDLSLEGSVGVVGSTKTENLITGRVYKDKTDVCVRGGRAVREYYCVDSGNNQGEIRAVVFECANGCVDKDGSGVCG